MLRNIPDLLCRETMIIAQAAQGLASPNPLNLFRPGKAVSRHDAHNPHLNPAEWRTGACFATFKKKHEHRESHRAYPASPGAGRSADAAGRRSHGSVRGADGPG